MAESLGDLRYGWGSRGRRGWPKVLATCATGGDRVAGGDGRKSWRLALRVGIARPGGMAESLGDLRYGWDRAAGGDGRKSWRLALRVGSRGRRGWPKVLATCATGGDRAAGGMAESLGDLRYGWGSRGRGDGRKSWRLALRVGSRGRRDGRKSWRLALRVGIAPPEGWPKVLATCATGGDRAAGGEGLKVLGR
ncbi:hypothetical protein K227x_31410 [Rubripirellula lacrimiformis]|uniref:Uncharacterized protein n=1 Tax=Rubripirellula lacrimiformis TaxID=1930273 RepID=A0A517NCB4_9BACT|nr:hypothetical protein K227x_31410 [Rubripirellula lacrimiformis]